MNLKGRREIYMCLAALFANWQIIGGSKVLIKSSFMEIFLVFKFSVHSAEVMCQRKFFCSE